MALGLSSSEAEKASEAENEESPSEPHNPFDTSSDGPLVDDESVADTEFQDNESKNDDLNLNVQDPKEKADGPTFSLKHSSNSSDLNKKAKEDKSSAEKEWVRRKALGEKSEVLDEVMLDNRQEDSHEALLGLPQVMQRPA